LPLSLSIFLLKTIPEIVKTVFVIGAGASKEAGLPIGSELTHSISEVLDIRHERGYSQTSGDPTIFEALRTVVTNSHIHNMSPWLQAAWHIRDAMPQATSIDSFIDSQGGDKKIELCGKLAIVKTVLAAEAGSSMFVPFLEPNLQLDFKQLQGTWFHLFMHLLLDGCKAPDLPKRLASIVLIIFNYDRCVEHYMYYAIQNYYRMSPEAAAKLLEGLEIYHPYGVVGFLPWQKPSDATGFGADPNSKRLLELGQGIRTFTEGTDESTSSVKAIRSSMETADKLVFLGFAFHRLNVQLLLPEIRTDKTATRTLRRHIYATAHGISPSNAAHIADELISRTAIAGSNVHVRNDLKCGKLIEEYSRSLSLA
jgi:hypothetical protein